METPQELEAHIQTELALKAEIDSLVKRIRENDYRTKSEKSWINTTLQQKRRELEEHLQNTPQV